MAGGEIEPEGGGAALFMVDATAQMSREMRGEKNNPGGQRHDNVLDRIGARLAG